jgi:hypothetical protein
MSVSISFDDAMIIKGAFKWSPYFDSTVFSFLKSEGYLRAEDLQSKHTYYVKEVVNDKNQRLVVIIQGDAIYVYKNIDKLEGHNFIKMFNFEEYRSFRGTYNQMCVFVKEFDG